MKAQSKKKVNQIKQKVKLDLYLKKTTTTRRSERKNILSALTRVVSSVVDQPDKISEHERKTQAFVKSLLNKYDFEQVGNFFNLFADMEPTMLTLGGTRDHLLHVFNVFLFGMQIISPLIDSLDEDKAKEIFKITDEDENTCVFPFPYDYKERIFYIWALSSLFHDIAYPLERLPNIEDGIKEFVGYFDYSTSPLGFEFDYPEIYEYHRYIEMISALYGGKMHLEEDKNNVMVYKKKPHPYVRRVLLEALRRRNHGLIGGLGLINLIEKQFLYQKTKYELSPDQYEKYMQYYFNEDVIRIGLIMALHHLKRDNIPKLPKLKFSEFPIACLLVISDELQEFVRKKRQEGQSQILIKKLPIVDVKMVNGVVRISVSYRHDASEADKIAKLKGGGRRTKAIREFWTVPTNNIRKRLKKDKEKIELRFRVFYKGPKVVYEWNF
jgi:hypothetical protein